MKITIDYEIDRHSFFDQEGRPPGPDVTEAELVLGEALSDYKQFAFQLADQALKTLKESN